MTEKRWCVLLSVASVLVMFCAVRAVRRLAASDAAQRIEVCAGLTQLDGKETNAGFQNARESIDAINVGATNDLQRRQLETARDAQQTRQEEAASELQRRQQEATRLLPENPRSVS
jgi:hypothetical protein